VVTLAMLALVSVVASPVLLALVAPLIFVAYVVNNAKTVKRARAAKQKIEETAKKIKEFFRTKTKTRCGLLPKLTPLETLIRVSSIFEVQTPPPRIARPV